MELIFLIQLIRISRNILCGFSVFLLYHSCKVYIYIVFTTVLYVAHIKEEEQTA